MALLRVLLLCLLSAFIAWPAFAGCETRNVTIEGRGYVILVISETNASASTEVTCTVLPQIVTLKEIHFTLTSGAGATLNPIGGIATNPTASTYNWRFTATNTAADVYEQTEATWWLPTGQLVIRPRVNAGVNNSISGELVLLKGAAQ